MTPNNKSPSVSFTFTVDEMVCALEASDDGETWVDLATAERRPYPHYRLKEGVGK